MEKTCLVFVVLTYRNSNDLDEFIKSLNKIDCTYKVLVVDAYYSEDCSLEIKKVADMYSADYIQIPNNGYSYGNNAGIEYATNNYDFEYVIVSNPDTCVEKFEYSSISSIKDSVIGVNVHDLNNKAQNPMYYKKNLLAQKFIYKGLKRDRKFLFYTGIALNKITNIIMAACSSYDEQNVFQLHGSFVIFPKNIIERLGRVFDDNMFLFAEESYLALRLEELKVPSLYINRIIVLHKQDGSMKFRNDINEQLKKANIYVFEKYYRFSM